MNGGGEAADAPFESGVVEVVQVVADLRRILADLLGDLGEPLVESGEFDVQPLLQVFELFECFPSRNTEFVLRPLISEIATGNSSNCLGTARTNNSGPLSERFPCKHLRTVFLFAVPLRFPGFPTLSEVTTGFRPGSPGLRRWAPLCTADLIHHHAGARVRLAASVFHHRGLSENRKRRRNSETGSVNRPKVFGSDRAAVSHVDSAAEG